MDIRRLKLSVFVVLLLPILAGCATALPKQAHTDLTFAHLGEIKLVGAGVEIIDQYAPPMTTPHIDHLVPVSPAAALQRWAKDRLRAAGGALQARFVIRRASLVEVPLKTTEGLTGTFKTEQSERYEVVVDASLELVDAGGQRRGFADATARRSRTVPEDATLHEREKVQFELVESVMDDFDAQMESNIRRFLAEYLKN